MLPIMKNLLFLPAVLFLTVGLAAQKKTEPTRECIIDGLVTTPLVITLDSLKGHLPVRFDSVVIINHRGERKSTLKNLVLVPARVFLGQVEIKAETPRNLSEFYFVFEAADGYKAVFSWNEIFNNKLGEDVGFIVGADGKSIENLDNRIAALCRSDTHTGRRHVKNLQKIWVRRAE